MIFDYFNKNFTFTLFRTYLFLFFTAAYSFLTYWIAMLYPEHKEMAIFGGGLYLFVLLFHIAIKKLTTKNETLSGKNDRKINLFFIILIIFLVVYIVGVWGMQWLSTKYLDVPKVWFGLVGSVLEAFSLFISFLISFLSRNESKYEKDFEILRKNLAAKSRQSRVLKNNW